MRNMTKLTTKERRLLRKAEQAVRLMAPLDREIFIGYRVDDASFNELAHRHAISVEEVEAALCRGLAILADVMEPEPPPWWRFWRR